MALPLLTLIFYAGLLFFGIVILIVHWIEIQAFISPNDYRRLIMINEDGSITRLIKKINPEMQADYLQGKYNMFDSSYTIANKRTAALKEGGLTTYIYLKGNKDPINPFSLQFSINAQLDDQYTKLKLTNLWDEPSDFGNLIKKYWWIFLIIGIAVILIILFTKQAPAPVPAGG